MTYWFLRKSWAKWARIRQDGQFACNGWPYPLASGDRFVAIEEGGRYAGEVIAYGSVVALRTACGQTYVEARLGPLQRRQEAFCYTDQPAVKMGELRAEQYRTLGGELPTVTSSSIPE